MNAGLRTGWVLCLVLSSMSVESACKPKGAKTDASSSASSSAKGDSSSTAAKTDGSNDDKSADGSKGEVDVNSLLDDESKDDEGGALPVTLPADKPASSARAIGNRPPPTPRTSGAKLTWIPAGSIEVPNFGFKTQPEIDKLVLRSPDGHGAVFFTTFKDAAEADKKVTDITSSFHLKEFHWKQKPKAVTLGPDKIPANLGGGHAIASNGVPMKLGYAFINAQPNNVLAVFLLDDSAPKATADETMATIGYIRKTKAK